MRYLPLVLAACFASLSTNPATGHEFWIEPEDYTVAAEEEIVANIRVGEKFKGSAYAYLTRSFVRFDRALGESVSAVEGREGDIPAGRVAPAGEGLHVLVYQTQNNRLTYDDFDTFTRFVTHKDSAWALEEHERRNLPQTGFAEIYSRYAKSLVQVGQGEGRDRRFGLETEIVAEESPYAAGLSELPVTVWYQDKPRADAQVEVFEKAEDGSVEVFLLRTDAEGRTVVPVKPGHSYLVDAVVLRAPAPVEAAATGAVWESLWASLTFAVPQ